MNPINHIVTIASIDIGSKNPCLYIEETDIDKLHSIKNIPKNKRYNIDKTPTKKFNKILNDVYKNGKCIYLEKFDVSDITEHKMFLNMLDYLESKINYFDKCDPIVIEQQLKENPFARRMEQVCTTFFLFKYRDTKTIIIFPSYHKTKVLGMEKYEKKLKAYKKKKIRKEWGCKKALEICRLREDEKTELHILTSKKKDDESDTIIQLQAFKYKCYVEKEL